MASSKWINSLLRNLDGEKARRALEKDSYWTEEFLSSYWVRLDELVYESNDEVFDLAVLGLEVVDRASLGEELKIHGLAILGSSLRILGRLEESLRTFKSVRLESCAESTSQRIQGHFLCHFARQHHWGMAI